VRNAAPIQCAYCKRECKPTELYSSDKGVTNPDICLSCYEDNDREEHRKRGGL
jgi:hypothetical protein